MAPDNFRGDVAGFLSRLLARESGIDPECHDWYVNNLDKPVLNVPSVTPDRQLVRNPQTGAPVRTWTTVRKYFDALGVGGWFLPGDKASLHRMQYASTNALGFIGYQFGEAVLSTHGIYEPEQVDIKGHGACPRLYCGDVSQDHWSNGQTEYVYRNPWSGLMTVATSVNTWRGRFNGRCGISTLDDLRSPEGQERLIRLLLRENSHVVLTMLGAQTGFKGRVLACRQLADLVGPSLVAVSPPTYTYSGLLAAAHLCGPNAVVSYLRTGLGAVDEFSTTLTAYIDEFKGYDLCPVLDDSDDN